MCFSFRNPTRTTWEPKRLSHLSRVQPRRAHLEPRLGYFPILDFVNSDDIDLTGAVRKGASDDLLVDYHVANRYPLNELAVKIGFSEPGYVPFADLTCAASQQTRWELIVFTVVGPPLHEVFYIPRVISLELFLHRELDVAQLASVHFVMFLVRSK